MREPLDAGQVDAIERALALHGVLVLAQQMLQDDDQVRLLRHLGEPRRASFKETQTATPYLINVTNVAEQGMLLPVTSSVALFMKAKTNGMPTAHSTLCPTGSPRSTCRRTARAAPRSSRSCGRTGARDAVAVPRLPCLAHVGWRLEKGRKLIDDLTAHATQSQFVYSHAWQLHDLVMWDNSATMHRATPYRAPFARRLKQGDVQEAAALVSQ
ncbi:TauD/TfdA dioxygenase family protein [Ramlibacter henchirensis]|uniref:TauD/TfdA dioxygenase family protein n=1 Tax=Ramlibacter henchirensis TaxID=204072 RepID=UPI001F11796A|nr:TauD/TfdA family dioxygenase [Ramlibacter henchirensis]